MELLDDEHVPCWLSIMLSSELKVPVDPDAAGEGAAGWISLNVELGLCQTNPGVVGIGNGEI